MKKTFALLALFAALAACSAQAQEPGNPEQLTAHTSGDVEGNQLWPILTADHMAGTSFNPEHGGLNDLIEAKRAGLAAADSPALMEELELDLYRLELKKYNLYVYWFKACFKSGSSPKIEASEEEQAALDLLFNELRNAFKVVQVNGKSYKKAYTDKERASMLLNAVINVYNNNLPLPKIYSPSRCRCSYHLG